MGGGEMLHTVFFMHKSELHDSGFDTFHIVKKKELFFVKINLFNNFFTMGGLISKTLTGPSNCVHIYAPKTELSFSGVFPR